MKRYINMLLMATKWMLGVAIILVVGMIAAVYFVFTDPHDSPLWAAFTMGLFGLVLGAVLKRGK